MSEIKVGDVVLIKAGNYLPADELVTVQDITNYSGIAWALVRVGGRGYRIKVSELKLTTVAIDKAELAELERAKVALMTISSYSETPLEWGEIVAQLENEANRLQASALIAAGVSPDEVREIQSRKASDGQ